MATDTQPRLVRCAAPVEQTADGVARILYINMWSSCHGGSSTSLLDIVSSLDRSRFEPLVLCPEEGPLPDRLRERGVTCHVQRMSPLTRGKITRFAVEVPKYLRFLKSHRIDLIHANTGCWRRSVALAAKLSKTPLIQHVRNPIENYETDFAFNQACRIVTNSDQVGRSLRDNPKYRERTLTIYNAVDLAKYADHTDRREELGIGDRPVVGFVGQLVERKGLATLIAAMHIVRKTIRDALLVVVGCSPPNDDSYERVCRRQIAELGLEPHVFFTGFRRDVPAWMQTFDVFALPTRSEPFGKVIVEAMAAGCPVVASAVGGIPEIIENSELGTLVEPDEPDEPAAIARSIVEFLSQPAHANQVAANALAHVHQKFGLRRMIEQLEKLYEEVLAK